MFGDEDGLRSCRAQIALLILLVVAVSAVCSRSLWNGFARDDLSIIVHNHLIEKWSTFFSRVSSGRQFFFRPVFGLWLRLNFEIVGRNAIGWHALKILVHLVAVLLVFDVARLLSGSVGVAMLTALFFGLLPAHDDAVAWVGSPEPLAAALNLEHSASWSAQREPGNRSPSARSPCSLHQRSRLRARLCSRCWFSCTYCF